MRLDKGRRHGIVRGCMTAVAILFMIGLPPISGCIHGDCKSKLLLRGKVLDSETMEGASDAAVGGRAFTEGEETDWVPALIFDGTRNGPPPAEDGTFVVEFNTPMMPCSSDMREFPRPDQVEIIVARDGCEQTFLIEINEDTVVDMEFPNDVIELKEPILVGPCEE